MFCQGVHATFLCLLINETKKYLVKGGGGGDLNHQGDYETCFCLMVKKTEKCIVVGDRS